MSFTDICYDLVHNKTKGGATVVASRMGMNKQVLLNKLNGTGNNKITVDEAAHIADATESDAIAKAFAERRNMVCIPIAQHEGGSDMELLDLFLAEGKEKGEWNDAVKTALSDGRVDPGEFQRINKEFMDYCAAGAELMSRLNSMVQERRKTVRGK